MVREPMGGRFDANPAPSGPERSEDDDELRKLGERIAELAARINSAEARMMTLIAEFDRRGGWKDGGYSSCAEWLAWRTGTKIGTARERVRTARALERLPRTADALKHGTISYAKVRALTRVATPEREAELLEFARAGSAAKLERTVRMLKKLSRDAELTAEQARRRSRAFSVFVDGDGMYVVKGRLEPEVGAVLMRAVEAASDALFLREADARDGAGSGRGAAREAGDVRPEPKQRRADAVGLLAERALAAGFGGGESGHARRQRMSMPSDADGEGSDVIPRRFGAPRVGSGTRAERYQVMVHCDAATLAAEGEPGRSDLDGIRVSAETSRRMACDAAVVAMVHAKDGSMLSVGRRTRTIPPHIRRALEERDRGCRFPRVWLSVHRGASREALGRRGRDEPPEHAAALPAAPPRRSRGAGEGIRERRRHGVVLHAEGTDAGRRAENAGTYEAWTAAGPGGSSRRSGGGFGCELAGPGGSSRRPGARRWPHAFQRGRALPRFGYPLGD